MFSHVKCSLFFLCTYKKYAHVLEVVISDAVFTVPDSSPKLMKSQDSFRYWTHSFGSCNQGKLLPREFLNVLGNNRRKIEQ